MVDLGILPIAVYGFLSCVGAIVVYFAVVPNSRKEKIKSALLILVSYVLFEMIVLFVLPIVFSSLMVSVSADSVRILAVFFVAPLLVALFIVMSVAPTRTPQTMLRVLRKESRNILCILTTN